MQTLKPALEKKLMSEIKAWFPKQGSETLVHTVFSYMKALLVCEPDVNGVKIIAHCESSPNGTITIRALPQVKCTGGDFKFTLIPSSHPTVIIDQILQDLKEMRGLSAALSLAFSKEVSEVNERLMDAVRSAPPKVVEAFQKKRAQILSKEKEKLRKRTSELFHTLHVSGWTEEELVRIWREEQVDDTLKR